MPSSARTFALLWGLAIPGSLVGSSPAEAGMVPVRAHAPRWKLSTHRPCRQGWAKRSERPRRRARARCAGPRDAEALPAKPPQRERRPARPTRQAETDRAPGLPDAPAFELDATAIMKLDRAACHDRLEAAGVDFSVVPAGEEEAVEQPIRVASMHGVRIHLAWSKDPGSDHHGVWDCRLALAMTPVAGWLASRGVDQLEYLSVLRHGRRRPRSRHPVGLAIDVVALRLGDRRSSVLDAYPKGRLTSCSNSRVRGDDAALWTGLVCHVVEGRGVHTLLTPDYDAAHRDHLHLDLKPDQDPGALPYVSFAD